MNKKTKASELLTPNRFDLGFKLSFLKLGFHSEVGKEIYLSHIKAFTLGKFTEPGSPEKNSSDIFLSRFQDVSKSISSNGFDQRYPIPTSINGCITNGAHRTACSVFYNQSPVLQVTQSTEIHQYDQQFFEKRGVAPDQIDFAAKALINSLDDLRAIIVWPRAFGTNVEEKIPNVFYRKKIRLSYQGLINYLQILYDGEEWVEDENSVRRKAIECTSGKPLDVEFLLFRSSLEDAVRVKGDIRSDFDGTKGACHGTDTQIETAAAFDAIAFGRDKYLGNVDMRALKFLRTKHGDNYEGFSNSIISGSTILELFGLRPARDLDVIHRFADEEDPRFHNQYLSALQMKSDELFADERLYFSLLGIRFLSPETLAKIKRARGEKKDLRDLALLGSLLKMRPKFEIDAHYNYARAVFVDMIRRMVTKAGLKKPAKKILEIWSSLR